jgi:endonuclease YncB( thermonuclease family)
MRQFINIYKWQLLLIVVSTILFIALLMVRASVEMDKDVTTTTTTIPDDEWRITRVIDGDTVEVVRNDREYTVRIIGIDTPERGECGYQEATDYMSTLVSTFHYVGLFTGARDDVDRYGRLIRYVEVNGLDVGLAQINAGLAIARYDSRDGYGKHPREDDYIRSDNLVKNFTCTGE